MPVIVRTTTEDGTSVSVQDTTFEVIAELQEQQEELQPVLDFYDRLVKGWQGRALRAEQALKDPSNKSEAQQKVFNELLQYALHELKTHLPVYTEVKMMKEKLQEKIQQFELMNVKNSLTPSSAMSVELDFKNAQELLFKADALIELRSQDALTQ